MMVEPSTADAAVSSRPVQTPLIHRLGMSAASLLVAASIYVWAVLTATGQAVDASSLALGASLRAEWGEPELARAADIAPWVIILPTAVALAICALRGRWGLAFTTAALPVVTYAVATLLHDYLLPRPFLGDFGYDINTLPSERLAVAIACCAVLLWLVPKRVPLAVSVVLLASTAGIVGVLEVAAFSSRFADVVVCAPLVAALAAWWLPSGAARSTRGRWVGVIATVALAGASATLMTLWWRSDYDPAAMPLGLLATGLGVGAGVIGLSLLLRRQHRAPDITQARA